MGSLTKRYPLSKRRIQKHIPSTEGISYALQNVPGFRQKIESNPCLLFVDSKPVDRTSEFEPGQFAKLEKIFLFLLEIIYVVARLILKRRFGQNFHGGLDRGIQSTADFVLVRGGHSQIVRLNFNNTKVVCEVRHSVAGWYHGVQYLYIYYFKITHAAQPVTASLLCNKAITVISVDRLASPWKQVSAWWPGYNFLARLLIFNMADGLSVNENQVMKRFWHIFFILMWYLN